MNFIDLLVPEKPLYQMVIDIAVCSARERNSFVQAKKEARERYDQNRKLALHYRKLT